MKKKTSYSEVGLVLIFGTTFSTCAGGSVPDNPTLWALISFVMGVIGLIVAIRQTTWDTLRWFVYIPLITTIFQSIVGKRHWIFGGFYLFDVLSIGLIFLSLVIGVSKSSKT